MHFSLPTIVILNEAGADSVRTMRNFGFCTYLVELHESKTIEYFCNYCLALVNSSKFLSCLGLTSQYEKYYCLVFKFLILLSYEDV